MDDNTNRPNPRDDTVDNETKAPGKAGRGRRLVARLRAPRTLASLLRDRAENDGNRDGFTFYSYRKAGPPVEQRLSYAGLQQRAMAIAATVQAGCAAGDRVVILCPPGLDYIASFFGCQLAGVVAVPAYPPGNTKHMGRLMSILADAGASAILAPSDLSGRLAGWADGADLLPRRIAVDAIDAEAAADWVDPNCRSGDLAFLQYTSGTTGAPKGVMVSQGNLITNLKAMQSHLQLGRRDVGAFWLPPYHDMGLVGGILQPLNSGFPCHLMSPAAFLQQPMRWLRMISQARVTFSLAPNFAYDLCVAASDLAVDGDGLDLSAWALAGNGAEVVRATTLGRFAERFAPFGFAAASLYPCYGMAEITLMATGAEREAAPVVIEASTETLQSRGGLTPVDVSACGDDAPDRLTATTRLVGCGSIIPDHDLRIVDPETCREVAAGAVGEIWLSGPSVAQGYWEKPDLTEATFRARIKGVRGRSKRYLRTGDLGALVDGEVFILGRIKEMIIIRGRNHYAQDIEMTATDAHVSVAQDRAAAFAVETRADGTVVASGAPAMVEERLVLVQEVKRDGMRKLDGDAVSAAIRQAIVAEHEIEPHAIVLIRPVSLPRTTSGKIRRRRARELFLSGELSEVARWERPAPASDDDRDIAGDVEPPPAAGDRAALEGWLRSLVGQAVGRMPQEVPVDVALRELGIDSLAGIQLMGRIAQALGVALEPGQLYDLPTIRALAAYLGAEGGTEAGTAWQTVSRPDEPIAIVGLACRFPGSNEGLESFSDLLFDGRSGIGPVPAGRWDAASVAAPPEGGFIEGIDRFDAGFFRIAPVEAMLMDPQQRLLLETGWRALEHAGLSPDGLRNSRTGVFFGISTHDYDGLVRQAQDGGTGAGGDTGLYVGTGNANSVAVGRLSYVLGLRGPALALDTACSSSLVALHQAVAGLQRSEADLALAGGVNAMLTPALTVAFTGAGMLSADGRCKTFDASADGYVRGEGCGVVVLKRLSEAERDGDRIHAVIRGSAVNHDGASNGLTAPSGAAQQALIEDALANAGLQPADVDYLEAHGTGTSLGDPIELRAALAVYGQGRDPEHPLLVGSVKTNIGHLE
uniref:beta-ketoacyl synthase N-terminal-like domain-containing protein n=1 Tax=Yoonia sp. R2-816 TaxID=3342638 RepID=UPI003729C8C9